MAQEGKPNSREEEIAQLRYMQTVYSQQYEIIMAELDTFAAAIGSLQRSIEALNNADRLSNSKTLLNLEGGAYVEASIGSLDRILLYVGGGYLVEKNAAEAVAYLKSTLEKQESSMKKLSSEKQKLESAALDVSYRLNLLTQSPR